MIRHLLLLLWNKKRENFLLALEVLLAFLVLFGISVFVLGNYQKYRQPLGFNSENLLVVPFTMGEEMDSAAIDATKEQLRLAMKNLAGVEELSYGAWFPFSDTDLRTNSEAMGYLQSANFFLADENMARAMQFDLLEGRWFTKADLNGKYRPVIVNRRFREAYFPGEKLADRTIPWGDDEYLITGVIDEYKYFGEFRESPRALFVPASEFNELSLHAYIRVADHLPSNFEEVLDQAIFGAVGDWEYDIIDLDWLRKESSRSTWAFMVAMLVICGFLVFNVALGLFGVVWYNTSKRRGEIGLRRALGATTGGISRHFVSETLTMTTVAILVGLFFAGQLPFLAPIELDGKIYAIAMLLAVFFIYTLVFVCSIIPSQQAAQIHPATALHEE